MTTKDMNASFVIVFFQSEGERDVGLLSASAGAHFVITCLLALKEKCGNL